MSVPKEDFVYHGSVSISDSRVQSSTVRINKPFWIDESDPTLTLARLTFSASAVGDAGIGRPLLLLFACAGTVVLD